MANIMGSPRRGRRRTSAGSGWLATLFLEAIALLAIIGVAHPHFFQSMLHRLGPQPAPASKPLEANASPSHFAHPMDAFQQPILTPAQLPNAWIEPYKIRSEAISILPPPMQVGANW